MIFRTNDQLHLTKANSTLNGHPLPFSIYECINTPTKKERILRNCMRHGICITIDPELRPHVPALSKLFYKKSPLRIQTTHRETLFLKRKKRVFSSALILVFLALCSSFFHAYILRLTHRCIMQEQAVATMQHALLKPPPPHKQLAEKTLDALRQLNKLQCIVDTLNIYPPNRSSIRFFSIIPLQDTPPILTPITTLHLFETGGYYEITIGHI